MLSKNQIIFIIGIVAAIFLIAWFSLISNIETKINNAPEIDNEILKFDASFCMNIAENDEDQAHSPKAHRLPILQETEATTEDIYRTTNIENLESSKLEICKLRIEALEVINTYKQIKNKALKTNIEIWALDDLISLEEREKEADKYFNQGLFPESINLFQTGIEAANEIIKQASILLTQNIDNGFKSLLLNNSLEAESYFRKALVIDPNNPRAIKGLDRSLVLEKVLNNLSDAELLVSVDSLDEAKDLVDEAYQLDNEYPDIDKIRLNIANLIKKRDFDALISNGYKNLKLLSFANAKTNFNKALEIDKNSKLAADGIILANAGIKKNKIDEEKVLAFKSFELEDFTKASLHFQNILKLDPNIEFAVLGLQEVRTFEKLEFNLDRYIKKPDRLSSPNVYSEAIGVMLDSYPLNLMKRLSSKKEQLELLLTKYSKEINITLISDNRTQVTIQNVGLIGVFDTREIKLKPGKYTFIGKRKGFVTTRKIVDLTDSATLSIQCSERL